MTRRLTLSVALSLIGCFTVICLQIRQASGSPKPSAESATAYRYRTSQVAHWRAIALRR